MSEWIPGGGIPPRISAALKEIGASKTEFMNMLHNGERYARTVLLMLVIILNNVQIWTQCQMSFYKN